MQGVMNQRLQQLIEEARKGQSSSRWEQRKSIAAFAELTGRPPTATEASLWQAQIEQQGSGQYPPDSTPSTSLPYPRGPTETFPGINPLGGANVPGGVPLGTGLGGVHQGGVPGGAASAPSPAAVAPVAEKAVPTVAPEPCGSCQACIDRAREVAARKEEVAAGQAEVLRRQNVLLKKRVSELQVPPFDKDLLF